ncbi:hypothetical protein KJY77_04620 [Canibacter sp. lx-72]|uniref:hypothetical protein n=1 Tax=Canibacter zhuwentaonis TaxID=2837491 RepID=UPI001BDD70FC|nr:hypothetical protein [Canibacter zhuwentaonis]MBT1018423.1 hypothetical protein [Canibacter zhuwentaonis]MBT1035612.1 hypothetical protein [Canibacter zhuwentaonis]
MSNHGQNRSELVFQSQLLTPTLLQVGDRVIEVTYLGDDSGMSSWILWNAHEPTLIGLLRQSGESISFEQRTSDGSYEYNNISKNRFFRMLEG